MTTTHSTPATTRRLPLISTLLLGLAVFGATLVGSARPAHAATSLKGCFLLDQRTPLTAGTPVHLVFWNGVGWQYTNWKYSADRYGCVYPDTTPWARYSLALYVNTGGSNGSFTTGGSWSGYSQRHAVPGVGYADLGVRVLQYSCTGWVSAC